MSAKYYAVKKGLTPGIYRSWDECKKQVDGYSGASYKSFKTEQEALAYMGISSGTDGTATGDGRVSVAAELTAYVDGSYNAATGEYSYGMVILRDGKEYTSNHKMDDPEMALMRNVAGEIEGARAAMQYAADNNIKSIAIYHDYEGIASWANGEWTANKKGTKEYVSFIKASQEKIRIEFTKVKGHSGVKYNEMADRLAKEGMNRACMDNYTTQFKEFLEKNVCEEGKFSIVIKNTVVTEKSITAFVKKMLKEKKYKKVTNLKIRYMIDENYLDVIFDANGEMKKELKIKILN